MKRMGTFLKYLILLVAVYFISNFIIDYTLYSSYRTLDSYAETTSVSDTGNYDVKITEARATNANGEISGEITKKEGDSSNFLKIDFFNKRNQLMGSEYVDISNIAEGENMNFSVPFQYSMVSRYAISTVNEVKDSVGNIIKDGYQYVKNANTRYWAFGILILLILIS